MSDDDRDEQDGPLYLVVTIKPRLDRLAEAEAQLQSMRKNTLTEPGCVFICVLYTCVPLVNKLASPILKDLMDTRYARASKRCWEQRTS